MLLKYQHDFYFICFIKISQFIFQVFSKIWLYMEFQLSTLRPDHKHSGSHSTQWVVNSHKKVTGAETIKWGNKLEEFRTVLLHTKCFNSRSFLLGSLLGSMLLPKIRNASGYLKHPNIFMWLGLLYSFWKHISHQLFLPQRFVTSCNHCHRFQFHNAECRNKRALNTF